MGICLEFRKNVRKGIKNQWHMDLNKVLLAIGNGMEVTVEGKKGSWDQALGYSSSQIKQKRKYK